VLLGIFAVQLKLATPQQLLVASEAWSKDQSRPLGEVLQREGVLSADDRALLERLIARQVESHHGDESEVYELFGGDAAAQQSFAGSLAFISEPQPASATPVARPISTPRSGGGVLTSGPDISLPPEHAGRYSIRGEQGRGGIGRVMVAFDAAIQREIALKELLPAHGGGRRVSGPSDALPSPLRQSSVQVARFLREARITGQLEHPGIVPVYELGRRDDGTVYYTMKLVRGATLADKLRACRNLGDRLQLLAHFLDLCQAIAYAHSRGVVHRDIKPANVMVGEFGETVLLDWGLAKVRGQADHGAEQLADEVRELKEADAGESVAGKPIGTPSYMPPEQADGRIADIDERSDVWSLGAVLYELLTGKPPFSGGSAYEVIDAVLANPVTPALELEPYAPPELAAIVMRCLQRDPAKRYQQVDQLMRDITAFQTGGFVSTYNYSTSLMLRRWAQRHWAVLTTACAAVLVLCGVVAISYTKVYEQRNAALSANARLDKRNNELLGLKLASECREQLAAGQSERASLLALQAERFYGRSSNWMPEVDRALRECAGALYYSHELRYSNSNIDDADFFPDGTRLAAVSGDGLMIWNIAQPGRHPDVYPAAGKQVAISPDERWIATGRGRPDGASAPPEQAQQLLLWDAADMSKPPQVLTGAKGQPRALAFSPDNRRLACGDETGAVAIWDMARLDAPPRLLPGHTARVTCAVFSPDSRILASVAADSTVRLWDMVAPDSPPRVLLGHEGQIYCATFTPDGKQLLTSASDDTIRFWDMAHLAAPPRVLTVHPGGGDIITGVAVSPDGKLLAASSYDDKLLRVWRMDQLDAPPVVLRGHENNVGGVTFSPDGQTIVSWSNDWTLRTWHIGPAEREPQFLYGQESPLTVTVSRDGQRIAVGGNGPDVAVWDPARPAAPALKFGTSQEAMRGVTISPDGKWLAAGGTDQQVRLWSMADPSQPPRVVAKHTNNVHSVAFSPDGRWLASLSDSRLVVLNDTQHLDQPPLQASCWDYHGHCLGFSPDSQTLAVGGEGQIWLYAVPHLDQPVKVFTGTISAILALQYSADGKTFVTAGRDALVRIWHPDQPDGAPVELHGHDGWLYAVAISPDGRFIASGGKDNTIRIWNAQDPALAPEVLLGYQNTVSGVAFTPDSKELVSCGQDSTVRVWHVGHDQLERLVERQPWRNLTDSEWRTFIGADLHYESTVPDLPSGRAIPTPNN
jgi:WD40 repeat protein/serine/threonine protein kinase